MPLREKKVQIIKPRLLLLTNESTPGDATGQINGFELLVETGEIESCLSVSYKQGSDLKPAFEKVLSALSSLNYDLLIIWSPYKFPESQSEFSQLLSAIRGRPILYWEGDAWGRANQKKPVTQQMSWWMSHSEIVFSTASEPHVSTFKAMGAEKVYFIPNTYCHIKFANEEFLAPQKFDVTHEIDFSIISSNTARIPGFTGSPSALKRWELIARLHFNSSHTTVLYGNRWPAGWSKGLLPYSEQAKFIRTSRVSLNWDNFASYEDYSSDRLPIALIAGRPHVTTKHKGMTWAPSEDYGLFQEISPKNVVKRAKELIEYDPERLWKIGNEAHKWAQFRLSHREAARYIVSSFYSQVTKPLSDPWGMLPGPW